MGTFRWTDDWNGGFADENDLEVFLKLFDPVSENPHSADEITERNTTNSGARKYRDKLEEIFEDQHNKWLNYGVPRRGKDLDYDALFFVEGSNELKEREIQVKGCFHSKKSNGRTNARISIPYSTHNGNGDDYLYHLGVYSFVEDVDEMEVLGETVLDYEAFDVLMEEIEEETPTGTNLQNKSDRKNHALVDWELVFEYAKQVQLLNRQQGLDAPREKYEETLQNASYIFENEVPMDQREQLLTKGLGLNEERIEMYKFVQ